MILFNISILLSLNEIQPDVKDINNSDVDKINSNGKLMFLTLYLKTNRKQKPLETTIFIVFSFI